jgi:hypothetical protein
MPLVTCHFPFGRADTPIPFFGQDFLIERNGLVFSFGLLGRFYLIATWLSLFVFLLMQLR